MTTGHWIAAFVAYLLLGFVFDRVMERVSIGKAWRYGALAVLIAAGFAWLWLRR